jgi:voltage-gated potassium channel Kch
MDSESELSYYSKTGAKVFVVAGSYIIFGAIVYHLIEKFSWVNSFYFVVITLATIGYGDIVPKTDAGKLFTIFFVIFGLAIFSALITNIVANSNRKREKREHRKEKA